MKGTNKTSRLQKAMYLVSGALLTAAVLSTTAWAGADGEKKFGEWRTVIRTDEEGTRSAWASTFGSGTADNGETIYATVQMKCIALNEVMGWNARAKMAHAEMIRNGQRPMMLGPEIEFSETITQTEKSAAAGREMMKQWRPWTGNYLWLETELDEGGAEAFAYDSPKVYEVGGDWRTPWQRIVGTNFLINEAGKKKYEAHTGMPATEKNAEWVREHKKLFEGAFRSEPGVPHLTKQHLERSNNLVVEVGRRPAHAREEGEGYREPSSDMVSIQFSLDGSAMAILTMEQRCREASQEALRRYRTSVKREDMEGDPELEREMGRILIGANAEMKAQSMMAAMHSKLLQKDCQDKNLLRRQREAVENFQRSLDELEIVEENLLGEQRGPSIGMIWEVRTVAEQMGDICRGKVAEE